MIEKGKRRALKNLTRGRREWKFLKGKEQLGSSVIRI